MLLAVIRDSEIEDIQQIHLIFPQIIKIKILVCFFLFQMRVILLQPYNFLEDISLCDFRSVILKSMCMGHLLFIDRS